MRLRTAPGRRLPIRRRRVRHRPPKAGARIGARARSRTAAVGASGSRGPCGKARPRGEVPSWPHKPSWGGPRSSRFRRTRSTRRPLAGRNRRRHSRLGGRSRPGSDGEDAPRSRRPADRTDAPAGAETDRARSGALANQAPGNLLPPPRGPMPLARHPADEPPGSPVLQRDPHTRFHRSSSLSEGCGLRSGSGIPADAFGRGGRLPRRTAAPSGRRVLRRFAAPPGSGWSAPSRPPQPREAGMMPIGRDGCKAPGRTASRGVLRAIAAAARRRASRHG